MKLSALIIRICLAAGFVFAAYYFSASSAKAANGNEKVTICHVPPGNPGNCHEITVSINALQAHYGHGDRLFCYNEDQTLQFAYMQLSPYEFVLKRMY